MRLGTIELDSKTAGLAPMAGVADMAFRELCVAYGATYVVSEMVSSKGLTMHDRKSKELLVLSDKERPAAAQLFGCDPETMAESARRAMAFSPDVIDINMGCPAPKIAGNGGGSALLKDPPLAEAIIRAVVQAVEIPVTVKIRVGWDDETVNAVEMAQRAENAGAAAIAVHGRTRQQMYAPPVHTELIAAVKRSVSIPVMANGDIVDGPSAAKMLEETNADYLLVGRGALGRPWIFAEVKAALSGTPYTAPDVSERLMTALRHEHRSYAGEGYSERVDFIGDLDKMLFPSAPTPEAEAYYDDAPAFAYVTEGVESNFDPRIETASARAGATGSLVMYRDSFCNSLLPFMAEGYASAYFSRGVPYQLAIDLDAHGADALVIERAQRFMADMAASPPVMAAPLLLEGTAPTGPFAAIADVDESVLGDYLLVTGPVSADVGAGDRIAVRVNGSLVYEAFGLTDAETGAEWFQLLVPRTIAGDGGNVYELQIW